MRPRPAIGQTAGVPGVEPTRSGFVDVNRTRLRVWEWGAEDDPAILCVHGAYDHGRMWDGLAPQLAAMGYRIVAPDLRGHGDSGGLGSGMMWHASALDLAMLARHAGPPVGLVGHSFGGGQALYASGVWPELFRWVVNIDGLGPPSEIFAEVDIVEAAARGVASAERVLRAPPRRYASLEEMAERRQGVNVRLPAAWTRHLVEHGARRADDGEGWVWKGDPLFSVRFPGEFTIDHLHAENEDVTVPVLVITGAEHDTWSELSADELQERLAHLRDARHVVIDGAGHYVHVEQPDAVLSAVASFLREVEVEVEVEGARA
jgi:pimeloyl-ACP methyl ester carboxylesterase